MSYYFKNVNTSLIYQQSTFERYHGDEHFSEFLPKRRRQKSTGTDTEHRYGTKSSRNVTATSVSPCVYKHTQLVGADSSDKMNGARTRCESWLSRPISSGSETSRLLLMSRTCSSSRRAMNVGTTDSWLRLHHQHHQHRRAISNSFHTTSKKVKAAHTRLPSVGFRG